MGASPDLCVTPDCTRPVKHPRTGICANGCLCVELGLCASDSPCATDATCGDPATCRGVGVCKACYLRQYRHGTVLVQEKEAPTCGVDDCSDPAVKLGHCNRHYLRLRRHGSPTGGAAPRRSYTPDSTCEADSCTDRPYGAGYCARHWGSYTAHGDPHVVLVEHLDWSAAQHCRQCGDEMRPRASEPDGRRVHIADRLCSRCYDRLGRTREQELMANRRADALAGDPIPEQQCSSCARSLPLTEYGPGYGTRNGFNTTCIVCALLRPLRISRDAYEELHASQGGLCAICTTPITIRTSGVSGERVTAHLDHDHSVDAGSTTCRSAASNRSLLCAPCNFGLGSFEDSTDRLTAAAVYLEAHAARTTPLALGPTKGLRVSEHVFDAEGQVCTACGLYLPYEDFTPNHRYRNGYTRQCRTCIYLHPRGFTRAEYTALLEQQGHRCPICSTVFEPAANGRFDRKVHIDHDHAVCPQLTSHGCGGKCLRGLLCAPCNLGLGNFRDRTDLLQNAVTYLEGHRTR